MGLMRFVRRMVPGRYRPYEVLCGLAWKAAQGSVAAGPFAGLQYTQEAANSALVPKLLGSYERELFPWVEAIAAAQPARIVDVGCAEGYYAVGFARRCQNATIVAFDRDDRARRLTARLADLNHVSDRVTVLGTCTPASLEQSLAAPASVVICDAEGAEVELLDPARVPALASAVILVEVHDAIVRGAGALLIDRFRCSHSVTKIAAEPRTPEDCPSFHRLVRLVPASTRVSLIVERPDYAGMYWLHMAPRSPALSRP